MIELHQFPRAFGLPNPSPPCMKVESYLRLAGLDYRIETLTNPAKAPKGKAPYITDQGRDVADSHFILAYLKERYGDPLGEGLDLDERARHHALARMMEEHLYFAIVHMRWLTPGNAQIVRDMFFGSLPSLVRPPVFAMVQRRTRRALHGQGMGRHSAREIERLAIEDLTVLQTVLGRDDYFGGDQPREIDCIAWSYVANTLTGPFNSPIRDAARAMPTLVAYDARMMDRVFPELSR